MICFVVNKRSGNGKAGKVWHDIEKYLVQRGIAYHVVLSSDAADARKQICEHVEKSPIQRVIVVGGDGTVHGILQVLIKLELPLGIIPSGSGNDLARGLRLPFDTEAALNHALNSAIKEYDCMQAIDRYAITVIGIGLDAEVAYAVNRSHLKKWFNRLHLGFLTYVFSLVHVLLTYRPGDIELTVDGQVHHYSKVWLMAAANLPYFGGGMQVSPHSKGDDGLLDICIVHGLSRIGLLRAFPKVYKGAHLSHPNVSFVHGAHIQATAAIPIRAHGDGESIGGTPISIQVLSKRLKVCN